jgi:hypothetical protein
VHRGCQAVAGPIGPHSREELREPAGERGERKRKLGVVVPPYQPARLAATTKVAAAKPNNPRIEGAATGCNEICAWLRQNSNSPSCDVGRATESFGDSPSDGVSAHQPGSTTPPVSPAVPPPVTPPATSLHRRATAAAHRRRARGDRSAPVVPAVATPGEDPRRAATLPARSPRLTSSATRVARTVSRAGPRPDAQKRGANPTAHAPLPPVTETTGATGHRHGPGNRRRR